MLRSTFIHMRGVGEKRECALWRRGIATWDDALAADIAWLGTRADIVRRASEASLRHLALRDASFFSERLPGHERLRLLDDFRDDIAFLDIETDPYRITMVGVMYRDRYRPFIAGRDLGEARECLEQVKVVVTYNGSCFDLPAMLRTFYGDEPRRLPGPADLFHPPRGVHLPGMGHIDLMTILHRRGIRGGLKASEERFGIARPPEVAGLDGFDAVMLWERYRRGEARALKLLMEYNSQDVINLKTILERLARAEVPHGVCDGVPARG